MVNSETAARYPPSSEIYSQLDDVIMSNSYEEFRIVISKPINLRRFFVLSGFNVFQKFYVFLLNNYVIHYLVEAVSNVLGDCFKTSCCYLLG